MGMSYDYTAALAMFAMDIVYNTCHYNSDLET